MAKGLAARQTILPAMLMLAGCGIVGPIYDPGLRNAPRFACAQIVLPPDTPQCFRFERRRIGGERLEMNDGTLQPDTEILAYQTGMAGCATGDLSFAVIAGSAESAGRVEILAFAGTGAHAGRTYEWDEGFQSRAFRLRGAGGPFISRPAIRVRSPAGSFRLDRVCLGDYWRRDILPLRAAIDRP